MSHVCIERMESRTLFAGNVTVAFTAKVIVITGDAKANTISIVPNQTDDGLVISGSRTTKINGRIHAITVPLRSKLTIDMGNGNDTLTMDRLIRSTGRMSLGVQLGAGDDVLNIKRPRLMAADILGGAGSDKIDITAGIFTKRLEILPGEQDDSTGLRDLRTRAGVEISDTAGRANIGMALITAGGDSFVSTGNSRDSLTISASHFNTFGAKLRGGNDSSVIHSTKFDHMAVIDGGDGVDSIVEDAKLQ